ncbi:hypothetical protein AALP_AA7G029400 [Arabis alpina]|uniref:Uncharacterized protein n=1 Tax=Arabis alpina TaxID=50452 RepID=A0A087GFL1_ARAAL|nr:hypothetical protein AALP_AA7G029400 [Arabis alpina]
MSIRFLARTFTLSLVNTNVHKHGIAFFHLSQQPAGAGVPIPA